MLAAAHQLPHRALRARAPGLKTRIWVFWLRLLICAGIFWSQLAQAHQVAPCRLEKTASGPGYFGFTGHYRHQASGLHLALYRAYDAELGRWLSRDPLAETGPDGPNVYAYVGNDPVNSSDPDGLTRREIELSRGWTAGVDRWSSGAGTNFQIHIYDNKGREAGIVTSRGGYQRDHGGRPFNRPASTIPPEIRREVRDILKDEIARGGPPSFSGNASRGSIRVGTAATVAGVGLGLWGAVELARNAKSIACNLLQDAKNIKNGVAGAEVDLYEHMQDLAPGVAGHFAFLHVYGRL